MVYFRVCRGLGRPFHRFPISPFPRFPISPFDKRSRKEIMVFTSRLFHLILGLTLLVTPALWGRATDVPARLAGVPRAAFPLASDPRDEPETATASTNWQRTFVPGGF